MGTGAVLVLIGLILAVIAGLTGVAPRTDSRRGPYFYYPGVLALAVILVAIGILVGHTQFHS